MKYLMMLLGALLAAAGISGVEELYVNWPALAAGTVVIVAFIKDRTNIEGFVAQLVSWGVGVALVVLGWIMNLGFLVDLEVWQVIIVAISTSGAANGFYKIAKYLLIALKIIKE